MKFQISSFQQSENAYLCVIDCWSWKQNSKDARWAKKSESDHRANRIFENSQYSRIIVFYLSDRSDKVCSQRRQMSHSISLFQNLADEKNHQRTESVINMIKRGEIKKNIQKDDKRRNKKDEHKKNNSNDDNDDKKNKCIKYDRVNHSKTECLTINSESFKCHKIDYWRQMCRIKKKNDQFNKKLSRRNDKIEDRSITEEITLMIKRLISEIKSVESAKSSESSFLVNSVNDHITRKILDSKTAEHIFCNQSSFISYILKIFICETRTREKFTAKSTESNQIKHIDNQNRSKLVILIRVLYSFQLQYNLISNIKLDKKKVEILFSLFIKTSKLLMSNDVIAVVDIINSQYVLRENFTKLRALAELSDLGIRIWHVRMRHLRYDNLIKLQNQIDELNWISELKSIEICESCMINR
jgi:hypothetical protein